MCREDSGRGDRDARLVGRARAIRGVESVEESRYRCIAEIADHRGCLSIGLVADGSLTGHGGGLDRKRWPLALEQAFSRGCRTLRSVKRHKTVNVL